MLVYAEPAKFQSIFPSLLMQKQASKQVSEQAIKQRIIHMI